MSILEHEYIWLPLGAKCFNTREALEALQDTKRLLRYLTYLVCTNCEEKMGREEQIEEREVLDSIFPDEITGLIDPYRR